MAPTINRFLEIGESASMELSAYNRTRFRKLPFGGRHINDSKHHETQFDQSGTFSIADIMAKLRDTFLSKEDYRHITNTLNQSYASNVLNKGKAEATERGSSHASNYTTALHQGRLLHITTILNESYFSNELYKLENARIIIAEDLSAVTQFNQTDFNDAVHASNQSTAHHQGGLPHITTILDGSYASDELHNLTNHKILLLQTMPPDRTTSLGPAYTPQDVASSTRTKGLILGLLVVSVIGLFLRYLKKNKSKPKRKEADLDMEEKGIADEMVVKDEEQGGVCGEEEWKDIPV